jgi:serine/threonine protein kinase
VTPISDAAIRRLRDVANWPEIAGSRYTIAREIGRGGMGTVYLAVDETLGREIALKVPNAVRQTQTAPAGDLEHRLEVEARALARLEHPGIVPIHDCGRLADGRLFYVMKHVKGRTLREQLHEATDTAGRLTIFERLCDPVAFAHAQGVVHRDLKPDNIMLGAFGEVIVMDWGASTMLSAGASTALSTGADRVVVGTRGFMAPEQAEQGGAGDARADVYSLGAILFLLLTNADPPATAAADRLTSHARVPRALRAICARALARDPAERYPSVRELADDVARFRAGLGVAAHQETLIERAWRFAQAYRVAILLVLAYIVMRTLVAVYAGW